jgi:hypothetical protein
LLVNLAADRQGMIRGKEAGVHGVMMANSYQLSSKLHSFCVSIDDRLLRLKHSLISMQVLFDFIDVDNSFKPGSYRLINSFPRRVLEAKACTGKTLQDVGLTSKQEALFLEQ